MVCKIVLLDACKVITENPARTSTGRDSQRCRDSAKITSEMPNRAVDMAIILTSPRTLLREARYKALVNAPTPEAAMRKPKVWAPPWRILLAKTGMRTVNGTPSKLISASSNRIDLMGTKP